MSRGEVNERRLPGSRLSRSLACLVSCAAFLGPGSAAGAQRVAAPPVSISDFEPVDGRDVRVNLPGSGEQAPYCNVQSEVTLARSGERLVAAWNDGGECNRLILGRSGLDDGVGLSLTGYGYSADGGRTWVDGGALSPPAGHNLQGDPVLAAGPEGNFYLATLIGAPEQQGGPPRRLRIGVARSMDGGASWSVPVDATVGRDPERDHDKPWVAVDTTTSPHGGNVYVAWTEVFSDCEGSPPFEHCQTRLNVLFSRSTDRGRTLSSPIKLSVPTEHNEVVGEYPGIGTQVAVGPNGEVYVGWVQTQFDVARRIWLARSFDGGETFEAPSFVGRVGLIGHPKNCSRASLGDPALPFPRSVPSALPVLRNTRWVINGDIRVGNWLSLAVDTSGSSDPQEASFNPFRGNIYLAVADDQTPRSPLETSFGDESDIAFIYSEDGGDSWRDVEDRTHPQEGFDRFASRLINDDRTTTDQFHPQVAVDSQGRVAVSWYDRRVSNPDNWRMEMWGAVSTDGGRTFTKNFPIGDAPFPPARTDPNTGGFGGCYMAEYNGMVGGDEEFLLAWGDNRDGPEAHPDPNVYFDRITFPTNAPPVQGPSPSQGGSTKQGTGAGNQDASESEPGPGGSSTGP